LDSREFALLRDAMVVLAEVFDSVHGLATFFWEEACNRIGSTAFAESARGGVIVYHLTDFEFVCH
jgi:hypothetical protein